MPMTSIDLRRLSGPGHFCRRAFSSRRLPGLRFILHTDWGSSCCPDSATVIRGAAPGCSTELHILPDQYVVIILANRDPPMATDMNDVIAAILPRGANQAMMK
jgi:hypothetical protein